MNIYSHCRELPLDVFIDCLVNKNLERLIISGSAGTRELGEAWDRLFWEYCELSGNMNYKYILQLAKDIGYQETKLWTLRFAHFILSQRHSQAAIESLRRVHCVGEFPIDNPGKYLADLRKVEDRIRGTEMELKFRKSEQENFMKNSSGKELSEQSFDEALAALSKFMGFRINRKEVTVTEFINFSKLLEASKPKKK